MSMGEGGEGWHSRRRELPDRQPILALFPPMKGITKMTVDMYERTYTRVRDRSRWGSGPWDAEPMDKVQWTDPATELSCLAVRNHLGSWCGYVGVTEDHPLFEKGYSEHLSLHDCRTAETCYEHTPEAMLSVHGGLTYADACQPGPENSVICHIPKHGQSDHVWWFGFDTAHCGDWTPALRHYDDETYRTLDYVRVEVTSLARQLADII